VEVVVTGAGAVTPLGLTLADTWRAMIEGCSGIDRITRFDTTDHEVTFAAEVKGFDPLTCLERRDARRTDRFTHFAVAAAQEAVAQSGLDVSRPRSDVGVLIGSGIGGIETLGNEFKVLYDKGPKRVSPFLIPMFIQDLAAGQLAILIRALGPNFSTVSACTSGAHAIGESFEIIRRGQADVMVAGGSEAPIVPIGVAAFHNMRALSTKNECPKRASRPFDLERDGFVIGEGGAALVLENRRHAEARGATIMCRVVGYGSTADAYHMTAPSPRGEGAARAMAMALEQARLEPGDLDYINAHGTSTPLNDQAETEAMKSALGDAAYRVPVSSTKSMIGHLLGAAGAVEAAVTIQAMLSGMIPPTINYEVPDPACDLDYVPNTARRKVVNVAMSNVFAFGGHNVSLIFAR